VTSGSSDYEKMLKDCCEKIDEKLAKIASSLSKIGSVFDETVTDLTPEITTKTVYPASAEVKLDPVTQKPVIKSGKATFDVLFKNESGQTAICDLLLYFEEEVLAHDPTESKGLSVAPGETSHEFQFAETLLLKLQNSGFGIAQLSIDMKVDTGKQSLTQLLYVKIPETITLNDVAHYLEHKRLEEF